VKFRDLSVRARLTVWYTAVLAILLVVFSAAVYLIVRGSLSRQMNRELAGEFTVLAGEIGEEQADIRELEPEGSSKLFQIFHEGKLSLQSDLFQKSGLAADLSAPAVRSRSVRSASGARFRVRSGPLKNGYFLSVALDEKIYRSSLRTLLLILVLALPFALLLSAGGGSLLAGRLLRPVAVMARTADRIRAENLSDRLPVGNPEDEFGRLAAVFNRTLARLEDAFERLRRFTADASHELRTPLAALQSVGEVALQEDLDAEAYRDRIGSMLEEAARLTRLVDSLLLLTRADRGSVPIARKDQDLSALVEKAVEDLRVMAEEKGQGLTMEIDRGLRAAVDAEIFRRAVVNVLDNAIKYTPRGGAISVSAKERAGEIVIAVGDSGPGIPDEYQDKVFDRFFRVETDRSGSFPGGAGLGLAIAKWAAEANGGRIELESRQGPGSAFRIVLPK
jgi:heavy metal sensor kinase